MITSHSFLRLKRFFLSEYFTDAFRITLSVLTPVTVLFSLGYPEAAITAALGALNIGVTEGAGTAADKKISLLISVPLLFLISLLVASVWPYPLLLAIVFSAVVFCCSMLTVYGLRYSILGISLIGQAIFSWGLKPADGLEFSLWVLAGSVWYYFMSYLYIRLWPLRSLKHAIAECLTSTSEFLSAKALFYDTDVPLDLSYKKLLSLHIRINDKQELVRNLLIRDRQAMSPDNNEGQRLIRIASWSIDLYDQITAIHYDYAFVREHFQVSGVLELVNKIIKLQVKELQIISGALQTNRRPRINKYLKETRLLEDRLQYIIDRESGSNAVLLSRLKHNIRQIDGYIKAIKTGAGTGDVQVQYAHFVSVQDFSFAPVKSNLSLKSPVFRFALRLTIACMVGLGLSYVFKLGTYNYWIVLTILMVIRPSFNITQKRNKQRLIGSLTGLVGGFAILLLSQAEVQISFAVIFLVGFLAFLRTNYLIAAAFITAMVVLSFNVYTGQDTSIILERMYDTLLGCVIAFAAAYLFPVWEGKRLDFHIKQVLESNIRYLERLYDEATGTPSDVTSYKLSRKSVYTSLASLSSVFASMQSEPRRSIERESGIYHFQVLNLRLSSMITSLFSVFRLKDDMLHNPREEMLQIEITLAMLKKSLLNMSNHPSPESTEPSSPSLADMSIRTEAIPLLKLANEIKECCKLFS
ncbi:putative membrane protein YccC [Arcticibacter pallidicorallinus]|uniref:Putative membrane protein YccC n=1 Tax=Arcticibacter pallidicorallinus TaxID=1259464 RepID=A0A2T0U4D9_9SPHI|nr:FUSC family membrane protein [Arcticibacter pallidicorallinus]PRY52791.1 putative membrane protein YccC [Arcticibacter pallidicorallinus]